MRALDANIVLRATLGDDPVQSPVAERLFDEPVLIPHTVLLEVAWVLRSRYGFARADIAYLLRATIDRSTVSVESPLALAWAIGRYRQQGDLPDLIHLVAAREATSFATLDRDLEKAAGPDSPVPIETLVA